MILLTIPVLTTFPMGAAEERFKEADRLIAAKEYDAALLLIERIVQEDPEMRKPGVPRLIEAQDYDRALSWITQIFEEDKEQLEWGQGIVKRINEVKKSFNSLLSQLDKALYEDKDVDAGLEIIAKLGAVYPYPNPDIKKTVVLAKKAAEYVKNKKIFDGIMDAAAGYIREGKPDLAVATYLSGIRMNLHKQEYLDTGYGSILENGVLETVDAVAASAGAYKAYSDGFQRLPLLLEETAGVTDPPALQAGIDRILALLRGSITDAVAMRKNAAFLAERNRLITEIGTEKREDYFISYIVQFTLGRKAQEGMESREGKEGIAFLLGDAWSGAYQGFRRSVTEKADAVYARAVQGYLDGAFEETASAMELANSWCVAAAKAVSLEAVHAQSLPGNGFSFTADSAAGMARSAAEAMTYLARAEETHGYTDLAERTLRERDLNSSYGTDLAAVERARGTLKTLLVDLDGRTGTWRAREAGYLSRSRAEIPLEAVAASAGDMAQRFADLRSLAFAAYRSAVTSMADRTFQAAKTDFQDEAFGNTAQAMRLAYEWNVAAVKAVSLDALGIEPGPGRSLDAEARTLLSRSAAEAVRYQARAERTQGYMELVDRILLERTLNSSYGTDLAAVEKARGSLKALLVDLDGSTESWTAIAAGYRNRSTRDIPMEDAASSAGEIVKLFADLRSLALDSYRTAVTAMAERTFQAARDGFRAGDFENSASAMRGAYAWNVAAVKAVSLDAVGIGPDPGLAFGAETREALSRSAAEAMHYQANAEQTRGYTDLAERTLRERDLNASYGADLAAVETARGSLKTLLVELDVRAEDWKAHAAVYRRRTALGIPMDAASASAADMAQRFEDLRTKAFGTYRAEVTARAEEAFLAAVADYEAGAFESTASAMRQAHDWSLAAVKTVALDALGIEPGPGYSLSAAARAALSRSAAEAVRYQALAEETQGYADLAERRIRERGLNSSYGTDLAEVETALRGLRTLLSQLDEGEESWMARAGDYGRRSTRDIPMTEIALSAERMAARFKDLRQDAFRTYRADVLAKADDAFAVALQGFEAGELAGTPRQMLTAYEWSVAAVKTISLDGAGTAPGPRYSLSGEARATLSRSAAEALRYQARAGLTRGYAEYAERALRERGLNSSYGTDLAAVETALRGLRALLAQLDGTAESWLAKSGEYDRRSTREIPLTDAAASAREMAKRFEDLRRDALRTYRADVLAKADDAFAVALQGFQAGEFDATPRQMRTAYEWSVAAVKTISLDGAGIEAGSGYSFDGDARAALALSAAEAVRFQARAGQTRGYAEYAERALRERVLNASYGADLAAVEEARGGIRTLLAQLDGSTESWTAVAAAYRRRSATDIPMTDSAVSAGQMAALFSDLRSKALGTYRSAVLSRADDAFRIAVESFGARDYENTPPRMQTAYGWSVAAVKAVSLDGTGIEPGPGYSLPAGGRAALSRSASEAVRYQANAGETRGYRDVLEQSRRAGLLESVDTTEVQAMKEAREALHGFLPELEQRVAAWRGTSNGYKKRSSPEIPMEAQSLSAGQMAARFEELRAQGVRDDIRYAAALSDKELGALDGKLAEIQRRRAQGEDLKDGTKDGALPSGSDIKKQPSQALDVFQDTLGEAEDLRSALSAYSARWKADLPYVTSSASMVSLLTRADADAKGTAAVLQQLEKLAKDAAAQHAKALEYRNDGDRLLESARTQLAAARVSKQEEDYKKARDTLRKATEQYGASINLEWEDALSTKIVADLPLVARDITDGLNAIVQERIANLVNDAVKQYSAGEYNTALARLQTAKNLRATLFPDPDTEIETWLDTVTNAIRATKGRELNENDANYAEVSQRLNIASNKYQQAAEAKKQGKTGAVLLYIDEANRELGYVTTLVPNNRIARVLRLQIQQLSDPTKYQQDRDKMVADARRTYQNSSDNNELNEAYLTLKDLDALSPNYAGVPELIRNLEYKLGYAKRPVDPATIAQSNNLYLQAKRLYDQGNRDRFAEADALLVQALTLYPPNENARYLRAAIASKTGVGTVDVLSPAALAAIDRAKTRLSVGEPYEADQILADLIRTNPDVRKYPPLEELQRKIKAAQ